MTEKRKTVSKDLNNQKILKEVQATSDEASRLLADLDSGSNNKSSNTKKTNSKKINRGPHQPYKYPLNEEERQDNIGITVGSVLISIVILASIINSGDKSSSLAPTTKRQMNTTERTFYSKTLRQAEDAVLIREHRSAISGLETLKRGKYKDLIGINQGIVNNKIIQAKKAIAYLDQPGDSKYIELANYGYQWFNKSPNNQFKVFFAHARKCRSPVLTFAFRSQKSGTVKKRYIARPKAELSTLYIPMQLENTNWIELEKVKCT